VEVDGGDEDGAVVALGVAVQNAFEAANFETRFSIDRLKG
jgi:hypothetical protein